MKTLHEYSPHRWSDELIQLSIHTQCIPLRDSWSRYLDWIYAQYMGLELGLDVPVSERNLFLAEVADHLLYTNAAYPKIGPLGATPIRPVDTAQDCIQLLGRSSGCHKSLRLAHDAETQPHLILRKWIRIDPATEFRIFIRDNCIAGISQYHTDVCFDYLSRMHYLVKDILIQWTSGKLLRTLGEYLPDVNVDVVCLPVWGSVTLLDIDPTNDAECDKLFKPGELQTCKPEFRYVGKEQT